MELIKTNEGKSMISKVPELLSSFSLRRRNLSLAFIG